MDKPKVFISVGSGGTQRQKDGAAAIFAALETAGLSPRQMGKNEWSARQPLRGIKLVVDQCEGAVVIAFMRYRFDSGVELTKTGEEPTGETSFPTTWNQIEAALGYARSLPLLVIAENGLKSDGLLESKYDWSVYWTDFAPEDFRSERFLGYLNSFKDDVLTHVRAGVSAVSPEGADVSKWTILQLLGRLSVPQLWAVGSAILGLLFAVASAAFKAGGGKWPWQ